MVNDGVIHLSPRFFTADAHDPILWSSLVRFAGIAAAAAGSCRQISQQLQVGYRCVKSIEFRKVTYVLRSQTETFSPRKYFPCTQLIILQLTWSTNVAILSSEWSTLNSSPCNVNFFLIAPRSLAGRHRVVGTTLQCQLFYLSEVDKSAASRLRLCHAGQNFPNPCLPPSVFYLSQISSTIN